MLDSYKHKGMRRQLVDELRLKGIQDEQVLSAMNAIPRHFFLDKVFTEQAYSNMAFQIGAGQTISHPFTVAFQTELLKIQKGDKVLEIGTGSGFQTAILCQLGAKVFSIERQKELFMKSQPILDHFKFSPKLKYGDGYKGWPAFAPFNSIIVTCGAPYVPEDLVTQLADNGRMVIPIGEGKNQEMILIQKKGSQITQEKLGVFSFVPMLKDTAR
jgi:protein-L-isoaspartate(D-aspartate) O-methyltransferase